MNMKQLSKFTSMTIYNMEYYFKQHEFVYMLQKNKICWI